MFAVLWALSVCAAGGEPPPPFGEREAAPADARAGVIEMNNGRVIVGPVFLRGNPLMKIFDRDRKKYFDLRLGEIEKIEVEVLREWIEQQWRWKEAGKDEKVYFGPAYPAREYLTTFVLTNGTRLKGDYSGPIYVVEGGKAVRYILHKRDKGPEGLKMENLFYIKLISFNEKDIEKAKGRAATQPASKPAKAEEAPGEE